MLHVEYRDRNAEGSQTAGQAGLRTDRQTGRQAENIPNRTHTKRKQINMIERHTIFPYTSEVRGIPLYNNVIGRNLLPLVF